MKKINSGLAISLSAVIISFAVLTIDVVGLPHKESKIPKILTESGYDPQHEFFEVKDFKCLYVFDDQEHITLYKSDGIFYMVHPKNADEPYYEHVVFIDSQIPKPNYRSIALLGAWILINKELEEFNGKLTPDPLLSLRDVEL